MATFSFGSTAPKPATSAPTFSFGTPATSAAPAPGATPSLFGSATAAPATGGLFGSVPATSSAGGGLFGSTTTSQAPATGGGLFGSATPATGSAAPSAGGLFGSTNAGTTGGLFGAKPPTTGTTGGLFGSTTQQQPATGGGLFGSTAAPATGGLFGSMQQQPQQQQQQQQQQQPQQQAPSLFGQSQSAASASLFGPKPAASSSFFGSANPLLGTSTTAQPTAPSAPIPKLGDPLPSKPNEPSIESRLSALKDAWDPSSPKCRFQTYFYNEVPAGQSVGMYSRPVEGARRDEWDRAVRENPEPEKLIPALALGFPSLQTRLNLQQHLNGQHQALLHEIHTHLDSLSSSHSLTTSLRTLRARQNAVALAARLNGLVAKASALSPARNAGIRREEDELRVELEGQVKGEVEHVKARMGELWAGVGAVKARKGTAHGAGGDEDGAGWAVADEEGLRKILEILGSQQSGLDHLTRTLQSMARDVDVMNEAFGLQRTKVAVAGPAGATGEGR
ncbi:nucleoporin Nup44 [Rhodotorula toruloides]|uniref:Nucleoporin Nup44 n=1 Tax=Rhodotorula toruloides TaxID=5286 RepID=A0A511KCP0_RHOTO|nr:nucleoporin Nup44 [Rhodotorula toruloides]